MAIAVGNSVVTNQALTPGNITLTMPSGASASSIVVLVIACGNDVVSASDTGDYTAPAGWTQIATNLKQHPNSEPMGVQVWWSLGNNINLTFTANNGTGSLNATKPKFVGTVMVNFTGVDLITPVDVAGTGDMNSGSSTISASSVNVATTGAWELLACSDWNGAGGTFAATGFTAVQNGTSVNQIAAILYNPTPLGTGSTGAVTETGTGGSTGTEQIISLSLALRPAGVNAVQFLESGSNSTGGLEFYTSVTGTVASDTAVSRVPDPRSIKCTCDASGNPAYAVKSAILANAGRRISAFYFLDALPDNSNDATSGRLIIQCLTSGALPVIAVGVKSTGVLTITTQGTGSAKAGTTPLSAANQYRISLSFVLTSTTNWSANLYINGNLEVSATNADFSLLNVGPSILRLGYISGAAIAGMANKVCHFSDVYVDNGTDLADPGMGFPVLGVDAFQPAANDVNGYDSSLANFFAFADQTGGVSVFTQKTGANPPVYDNATPIIAGRIGSWESTCGATGAPSYVTKASVLADAGRRTSSYFYFDTLPGNYADATTGPAFLIMHGTADSIVVGLRSTGILTVAPAMSSASFVAGTNTLSAATAYRIAVSYVITSTTNWSVKVYVNGNLEIAASNTDFSLIGTLTSNIQYGYNVPSPQATMANKVLHFDELYVDAGTDLSDPRPSLGLASRWLMVNEVPISLEAGWSQASSLQAVESYGLESPSQGSVDLTDALILGRTAWMWSKGTAGGTGTPGIVDNGTTTAVTLTNAASLFTQTTTEGVMPRNVGMRSTGSIDDSFLYECGTMIAYVAGANLTGRSPLLGNLRF